MKPNGTDPTAASNPDAQPLNTAAHAGQPGGKPGLRRRTWLLSGLGLGGALVLGWGLLPPRSRLGTPGHWGVLPENEVALNGWIKVLPSGEVVLAMARSEMGQGVHTALPMLVAEELDLPLHRVSIEAAQPDRLYGNVGLLLASLPFHPDEKRAEAPPLKLRVSHWMVGKLGRELGINVTGGSSSVADAWQPLRLAAATARASLLASASLQWKLPLDELAVVDGEVRHPGGRRAHFGELARGAVGVAPGPVTLKAESAFRVIGRAAPRKDMPDKVFGRALFGADVRPPGLLFASIRMAPQMGGAPGAIDASAALALPGVLRLVRLPALGGAGPGFVVVGRSWWHAERGAAAVRVDWRPRLAGPVDSQAIRSDLEAVLDGPGHVFYERGDTQRVFGEALGRRVGARYFAPYLAHATLEPMNATAQVQDGRVRLWVPTQVPDLVRAMAARVAGVAVDRVDLVVTPLGGGFGRRLEVDVAAQAVRVALECGGRPVQLTWPREQDFANDYFRPMQVAQLDAVLDADGLPLALNIRSAGDAISPRWLTRTGLLQMPVDGADKTTAEGLFDQSYAIPHQRMAHRATRHPVPVGFWRAVGHSQNAFYIESFMDELAEAAGQDPIAYRRRLLAHHPRSLALLDLVAEKSGWGRTLPAGHAQGLALHGAFGSLVAMVVEASIDKRQTAWAVRVHRVDVAIHCGTPVNPDGVAQQMEGSVVFALSAALHGDIRIEGGAVSASNFPTQPLIGLAHSPRVDTHIQPSTEAPTGVGEPAVAPLAPALANALFRLDGLRRRELPLRAR